MGLSTAGRNLALDAVAAAAVWASLHTADPGDTGAGEVTGGSPAYARKAATWGAAAAAAVNSSNAPVFDVPAGVTVTHVGYWSAASGGTFYGAGQLASPLVFSAQGTFTLNSGTAGLS